MQLLRLYRTVGEGCGLTRWDALAGWRRGDRRRGDDLADPVATGLGKPDHALRIDCNAIGIEFLDAFLSRKRKLLYLSRVWVQLAQRVGVEFGEPDIPFGIKRDIVGRTG